MNLRPHDSRRRRGPRPLLSLFLPRRAPPRYLSVVAHPPGTSPRSTGARARRSQRPTTPTTHGLACPPAPPVASQCARRGVTDGFLVRETTGICLRLHRLVCDIRPSL